MHRSCNPLEQVRTQILKLLPGNLGLEVNVIQQALNLGRGGERGHTQFDSERSKQEKAAIKPFTF